MKTEGAPASTADLKALADQFRDTKHNINNVFAVLLAMAELSERNPANYERLAKAVLERCQDLPPLRPEQRGRLQELWNSTAPCQKRS
jgi:hypothetical protein